MFFNNIIDFTAWKVSKYGVFSGPCFLIYSVNLCIQSEYKKIRTRKNSVFGQFSRSVKNPVFTSTIKKAWLANRTQVCNLEIWIKKTLSLPKLRGVIRENIIMEISKTGNNSSIKWGRCPYVVTYCLEKIMDIPSSAFFVSRAISSIENSDRKFCWSADLEFCTRLGIWNCKSV